jgi:hypothetical protein
MQLSRSQRHVAAGLALAAVGVALGWGLALAQGHVHGHHAHQGAEDKGGWYLKLSPDARARAVERQLRGMPTAMAEVAYRYTEMYFGGIDGNWDYAAHMAQELRAALEAGLERRPRHRKSAEAIFLKGALPSMAEAITRKDVELFRQRVETLRAACTACHAAEGVPFIRIAVPTTRINPVAAP